MRPFRPSNGDEGVGFMDAYCFRCEKDAKYRETDDGRDSCPIASNAIAFDLKDPEYPVEWQYADDGRPTCTAFEPELDPETRAAREERAALAEAGQKNLFL